MSKAKDITGKKFGRLTAIKAVGIDRKARRVLWECRCDCESGKHHIVSSSHLIAGRSTSCGCLHKEKNRKNLAGQKFGRLTAIRMVGLSIKRQVLWECLCECGNSHKVEGYNLSSGRIKSCGCLGKAKDLTGQKFGRLTVIARALKTEIKGVWWKCLCECGGKKLVSSGSLVSGNTRSCGCLRQIMSPQFKYEKKLANQRQKTLELSDSYIKKLLTKRTLLNVDDIPPEMVEFQRLRVSLIRESRNAKNGHQQS